MPEYLIGRCCLCPNKNENKEICPGIKGTPHPEPSTCRFVKTYIDSRGWSYKVMSGIGQGCYKARYQKPDKHGKVSGWKGFSRLPWRESFDKAQDDLNEYAKKKSWNEKG